MPSIKLLGQLGQWQLTRGGVVLSSHDTERQATEASMWHALQNGVGTYILKAPAHPDVEIVYDAGTSPPGPTPPPPPPGPTPPPPGPTPPPPGPTPPPPGPTPPPPGPTPPPPPSGPSDMHPACSTIYGAGFVPITARVGEAVPPLSKPAKGAHFREPTFGTCMVRATDHAAEPPRDFSRNNYSRTQAFNNDSTRFVTYGNGGEWHLYDARTLAYMKKLPGLAGDAEPQWHPTDPKLLYFLPTNGIGMKIYELNVETGAGRTVVDLAARIKARWPTANAAWTKSEGSPSADARYWCLMVDNAGWQSLGVLCYDMQADAIVGFLDTAGDRPDHVSMTPSGLYCAPSWDSAKGTRAYSRDFSVFKQLHHKSEHSDFALDANGDDTYVGIDFQSNAGDVFMTNCRTGVKTVLYPTYVSGSHAAHHFSGRAFRKPGWVLVSTYGEGGPLRWYQRKVFAMALEANPRIVALAHHRCTVTTYFAEPHASVNRDFTKVLFNSNWGVTTGGDTPNVDAYIVELPPSALA
jgi:hypothetical protein